MKVAQKNRTAHWLLSRVPKPYLTFESPRLLCRLKYTIEVLARHVPLTRFSPSTSGASFLVLAESYHDLNNGYPNITTRGRISREMMRDVSWIGSSGMKIHMGGSNGESDLGILTCIGRFIPTPTALILFLSISDFNVSNFNRQVRQPGLRPARICFV